MMNIRVVIYAQSPAEAGIASGGRVENNEVMLRALHPSLLGSIKRKNKGT